SPGEVSRFWTNRSLDYIRADPGAWLTLMARKAALTFSAAEVSDTECQDVYAEWSWLLRILRPFDFGLLLGMAVLGAVLTVSSWRRLWLLYAIGATYAVSVVLFFVLSRYRFPLVPVLMILAAGGLAELIELARRGRGINLRTAVAVAACAVAVLIAHLPSDD